MSSDHQKRAKQLSRDALYYQSIGELDLELDMREMHTSVGRNSENELEFTLRTISPNCDIKITIPKDAKKEEILKIWSLVKHHIETDFEGWKELLT